MAKLQKAHATDPENPTLGADANARSLVATAYETIRADIINGSLAPGTALKLDALKRRYAIGLSPIREALSRLASDTFVISIENRGFRVAEVSKEDLIDITNNRVILEHVALRESIAGGNEDWEVNIVAAHYRLSKLDQLLGDPSDDLLQRWESANRQFHDSLVAACKSKWLWRFRELLQDQSKRYRQLSIIENRSVRDVSAEHKAIMDATLNRDIELACDLIEKHIRDTAARVLATLAGN
ncbi:MAG: GntR family transcriptional regulator [Gammaproteobacteria bacterium]